ncbi:hypothetical protein Tco_1091624 [Tanacetum coccineum]|uniref:Uncharacterized protein n=1 Tax=Tanacetum coccineum TaxID=301880 RepID=A0ABQ5I7I5_9ASTR
MKLFMIGTSKRKSLDKENVSKQGRKSDKTKPMFEDSDFVEVDMENVEGDAETQGRNTVEHGDPINTTSIDVSAAGPSNVSTDDPSTSTTGDIFEDEIMTIANTLVATAASLDATQASGDRPRCQKAMGAFIAQTRSERASKHSYDSPLLGVNIPGSDEERLEQHELMDNVPPTPHDLPLSGGHTPGSDEVKRLEKKLRARTPGMKLFMIGTSKRKSLDKENVSKQGRKSNKTKPMFEDSDFAEVDMENVEGDAETQGRNTVEHGDTINTTTIDVSAAGPSNVSTVDPFTSTAGDIFKDEMMTISDTLVAIRSTRPRTTSVVIHDIEEEPRRATLAPIFEIEQRIAREKAVEQEAKDAALIEQIEDIQARIDADYKRFFAVQRAEQIRKKPPTRTQLRSKMITYLKNMGRFTYNQLKNRSLEEIQMLYEKEQKWINEFVPMDSELEVQRLKRADWEVYSEDTRRDDLVKLWDLIKERFSTTKPTNDKEKELWVELKRLFEPDNDDILWKLQRYMHDPLFLLLDEETNAAED